MQKLKTLIDCLSNRYYFWSILLFYNLVKLCPFVSILKISTYIMACVAFLYLGLKIIKNIYYNNFIKLSKIRILTIIIVFFAIISYIINLNFNDNNFLKGRDYVLLATYFINFFATFTICFRDNDFNKLKFINKTSNIIVIFSFIYGIASIIYTSIVNSDRINGFSSNVINYSQFVIVAFACSLYLSLQCNNKFKRFYVINCFLQFVILIFNQQRNAYLGFFAGAVMIIYVLYKCNYINIIKKYLFNNKKIIVIALIFIVFLFALLVYFINLSAILIKFKDFTGSGRFGLWKAMLPCFFENNITFGYGGTTYHIVSNYLINNPIYNMSERHIEMLKLGYTHNIYLAVLFDFGFVGLCLIIVFIISLLKKLVNYYKIHISDYEKSILFVIPFFIISPLVMGLFDENIITNFSNTSNTLFFIFASFLFENEYRKQ